jgi:hypothetical protein
MSLSEGTQSYQTLAHKPSCLGICFPSPYLGTVQCRWNRRARFLESTVHAGRLPNAYKGILPRLAHPSLIHLLIYPFLALHEFRPSLHPLLSFLPKHVTFTLLSKVRDPNIPRNTFLPRIVAKARARGCCHTYPRFRDASQCLSTTLMSRQELGSS